MSFAELTAEAATRNLITSEHRRALDDLKDERKRLKHRGANPDRERIGTLIRDAMHAIHMLATDVATDRGN